LLELESFNVWRKATVLIIVILDYLEANIKVSDDGMKTVEFNEYKKSLRVNGFTNRVLAII